MGSPLIDALLRHLEQRLVGNVASRAAQGRSSRDSLKTLLPRGQNPVRRGFDFAPPLIPSQIIGQAFLAFIRGFNMTAVPDGITEHKVYLRNRTQTKELIQPSDGRTRDFATFGLLDWGDRRLALGSKDLVGAASLLAEVVNILGVDRALPSGATIPWSQHAQFLHPSTNPTPTVPAVTLPHAFKFTRILSTELATVPGISATQGAINGPGGPGFIAVLVTAAGPLQLFFGSLAVTPGNDWSIRALSGAPGCGLLPPSTGTPCPSGPGGLVGIKVTANPSFDPGDICSAPWLVQLGTVSIGAVCGQPCQVPPATFPDCADVISVTGPTTEASADAASGETFTTIGLTYDEPGNLTTWLLRRQKTVTSKRRGTFVVIWSVRQAGRASCCFSGVVCAGQGWCEAGYLAWYGVAPVVCGGCTILRDANTTATAAAFQDSCSEWNFTLQGLKVLQNGAVVRDDLEGISIVDDGMGCPALSPGSTTGSISGTRTSCAASCVALKTIFAFGHGKPGGGWAIVLQDGGAKIVTDLGVGSILPTGFGGVITQAGGRLWLTGSGVNPGGLQQAASTDLAGGDIEIWDGVAIPSLGVGEIGSLYDALKVLPGKGAVVVGLQVAAPAKEGRLYQFNQPAAVKTITLHVRDTTLDLINDPAFWNLEAGMPWPQYRWRVINL